MLLHFVIETKLYCTHCLNPISHFHCELAVEVTVYNLSKKLILMAHLQANYSIFSEAVFFLI